MFCKRTGLPHILHVNTRIYPFAGRRAGDNEHEPCVHVHSTEAHSWALLQMTGSELSGGSHDILCSSANALHQHEDSIVNLLGDSFTPAPQAACSTLGL